MVSQALTDGLVVPSFGFFILTDLGVLFISYFRERGRLGHPWEGESSLETKSSLLLQSGDGGDCRAEASRKVSV